MTHEASDSSVFAGPGMPEGLSRPEIEAAQWLSRLTSGEADAADVAEFRAWCARAAQNRTAFRQTYRLWRAAGPALRAVRRLPRRAWPLLALAASLLLVLSLGYDVLAHREPGWTVAVSSSAVLRLDASQGHCRLLLGAGEDSFDVTPTGAGGAADETQVQVDDAAFSLRPYAAGVLVTVNYGQVKASEGGGMRLVAAGQQMSCEAASRAENARPRRELAWQGPQDAEGALAALLQSAVAQWWPAWRRGGAPTG